MNHPNRVTKRLYSSLSRVGQNRWIDVWKKEQKAKQMDDKKREKAQEIEWIQQLDPEATFKPKTINYVTTSQ